MSKTLRWVFILLPCVPGLTLLGAAFPLVAVSPGNPAQGSLNVWRAEQLAIAGGAVLLAGLVIGAFVAWRIAHPHPEPGGNSDGQTRFSTEQGRTAGDED